MSMPPGTTAACAVRSRATIPASPPPTIAASCSTICRRTCRRGSTTPMARAWTARPAPCCSGCATASEERPGMYTDYYGLTERPFQLTPDARFWFESRTHKKAMAYLGYGLAQGEGFITITGDIGAGKSTLVAHLLA